MREYQGRHREWIEEARMQYEKGEWEEAHELLDRVLNLDVFIFDAYYLKWKLLMDSGDVNTANRLLSRCEQWCEQNGSEWHEEIKKLQWQGTLVKVMLDFDVGEYSRIPQLLATRPNNLSSREKAEMTFLMALWVLCDHIFPKKNEEQLRRTGREANKIKGGETQNIGDEDLVLKSSHEKLVADLASVNALKKNDLQLLDSMSSLLESSLECSEDIFDVWILMAAVVTVYPLMRSSKTNKAGVNGGDNFFDENYAKSKRVSRLSLLQAPVSYFYRANQLNPSDLNSRTFLMQINQKVDSIIWDGCELLLTGNFEEAVSTLSFAIQLRDTDVVSHFFRGVALRGVRKFYEALQDLQKAREKQADKQIIPSALLQFQIASTSLSLAKDLLLKKKLHDADATVVHALQQAPSQCLHHLHDLRGDILLAKGDLEMAIAEYEYALSLCLQESTDVLGRFTERLTDSEGRSKNRELERIILMLEYFDETDKILRESSQKVWRERKIDAIQEKIASTKLKLATSREAKIPLPLRLAILDSSFKKTKEPAKKSEILFQKGLLWNDSRFPSLSVGSFLKANQEAEQHNNPRHRSFTVKDRQRKLVLESLLLNVKRPERL